MNSKKPCTFGLPVVLVSLILALCIGGPVQQTFAQSVEDATFGLITPGGFNIQAVQNTLAAYQNHAPFPIYYDEWTERASVTIADINNDGRNELLLPTYEGNIYAWNASGQLLSGFPLRNPGWHIRGRLALGDLNHDGDLEIAAGLESPNKGVGSQIKIWEPNGQVYSGWPQNTACLQVVNGQLCAVAGIILADLDKDSNLEVIAGTTNREINNSDPSLYTPNLYVWKSNGVLASGSWPNEDDHNVAIIGQMAVGDLDRNGYLDIVTGRDYNRLFAFDRTGANLKGWPRYVLYPYDSSPYGSDKVEFPRSAPALADLNQDGSLEYIISGHRRPYNIVDYFESDLFVYTAGGTRFTGWERPAEGGEFVSSNTTKMIEAPSIADLTNDGKPEIIIATQDGWIRAYTATKQVLWAFNYAQGKEIHSSEAVIGDVDGDGWNEVIFGTFAVNMVQTQQVGVYILDHNGVLKQGSPLWVPNSQGISSSPALGDLDGDGLIEIAAATYNGWMYVWDASGSALPERLPWPMPRHDLQRTGRYYKLGPNFSLSRKSFDSSVAGVGETITSTIELVNSGSALNDELQVKDVIPDGLSYVPGSLHASTGQIDDSEAPTLRWIGTMPNAGRLTISYDLTVSESNPRGITNTAVFDAGVAGSFSLSATIIVNGKRTLLPLIRR